MTEHESWQVYGDAAEVYERCFVPAIFGRWAPQIADAASVASEDRVLDVGCGTGVLTRAAAVDAFVITAKKALTVRGRQMSSRGTGAGAISAADPRETA
jgi:2-polyprenyl-3-methyl-5-hydroxy-6-metoxy-1,4-benzoquinol methylase